MQAMQSSTAYGVVKGSSGNQRPDESRCVSGSAEVGAPLAAQEADDRFGELPGLAHDVRNLLGALRLYADLLASPGVLCEPYREYAEDLRLLSDRSSQMVSRLLRCQQRSAVSEELSVVPEVVRALRGPLSQLAGCRLQLEFAVGSEEPVKVSRETLERILTNLVKNAGEAMESDDGTVTVKVDRAEADGCSRVVLAVSDDGRGMTGAQLGSLGCIQDAGPDGHGLGFRVVRELVDRSSGSLRLSSAPGEGTVIFIEWPIAS